MKKEEKLPDDINDADEEDGIAGIEVIKGDEKKDKDGESDEWLDLDEDDPDSRLDLKLELGSSYSGDSDDQF